MQNMKILSIFFGIIFLMSFASAVEPEFIFEKNSTPILTFSCNDGNTGARCDSSYDCNLNVNYPNGSLLFNNSAADRVGDGLYALSLENITQNGFYIYNGVCTNGTTSGTSDDLFFRVTESGQVFSEGQGIASLGIIASIMAICFFFLIFGYKFTNNPKTYPLALLFVIISIFLVLYALQLGLQYSVDILEYPGLSDLQSSIYVSVLFLVTFVGLISFIFMMIAFIREFGKGKMMKNFGEGFDPLTQTYK
jgi:hypothetical protein